jgi:superoxide dismutase, Fe-Mn family
MRQCNLDLKTMSTGLRLPGDEQTVINYNGSRSRDNRVSLAVLQPALIPSHQLPTGGKIRMAYEVPALPYDYSALEPYIDTQTMHLHHDKHHQAYVTNLNAALEKAPELQKLSAEELLKSLENVPEAIRNAVRNNGGGHVNHTMFWKIMGPNAGGEPSGAIAEAIKSTFGDFNAFKEKFNDAGLKQFGSGWAWLVRDQAGKLQVMSSANQDNPMSQGFFPIMGNDVWEHAYYLKYQNRRGDYLKEWWNVVNWAEVNNRFQSKK